MASFLSARPKIDEECDMPIIMMWVALGLLFVNLIVLVLFSIRGSRENEADKQKSQALEKQREALAEHQIKLTEREDNLAAESKRLREESSRISDELASVRQRRDEVESASEELAKHQELARTELERISGLTHDEARAEIIAKVEADAKIKASKRAKQINDEIIDEAQHRAKKILVTAIQRVAAEQTSESVVTTVDLPSDDMKGRIIGREGRNIRVLEQITGVNVIIDDTPGVVLLSCFDPVRREAARLTLTELIADGRINPSRIEEMHKRSEELVAESCRRAAVEALNSLNIGDVAEQLLPVIGALQYRTSYGQNDLQHMVESGRLGGAMAAELGLDVASCKRAAFMHDIGKAVVTSGDGSHALEGAELAKRYGESEEVVNAIASHHGEVPMMCVEAALAQAADAISGSRPGARRESLESYVHRLERIEEIGRQHDGVERVYAMQSGREVRVMVLPDRVPDNKTQLLADQIADEIQSELTYPGNVKVVVVRESRATATAS